MAHSCPICDQVCHCKGDIDDIIFDREPKGGCVHYKSPHCEQDIDEDDWDSDLFDEQDTWPEDQELIRKEDGGLEEPDTGIIHYP